MCENFSLFCVKRNNEKFPNYGIITLATGTYICVHVHMYILAFCACIGCTEMTIFPVYIHMTGVFFLQGEEGGEGDALAEGEAKKKSGKPEKRLRNQFNFSERASQTLNNPYRVSCLS